MHLSHWIHCYLLKIAALDNSIGIKCHLNQYSHVRTCICHTKYTATEDSSIRWNNGIDITCH